MSEKPNYEAYEQRIIELSTQLSESKKLEKALQESEKKYRHIVESTDDWVWSVDIKGIHTFTNKSIEQHLGYKVEESTGSDSFQLMHPDDKDGIQKTFQESVDQKKGWSDLVIRWIHKDGSIRYFESSAHPVFDGDDNLIGFNGIDRDITDRKQILERTERLNSLNERLLVSGGLNYKVKLITEEIIKIFKADFARIWMIKPGDLCDSECKHAKITEGPDVCRYRERCLHLLASSGRYTHIDGGHGRVPFGSYKIGKIASGDEPKFLTNDVVNDPRVSDHEWSIKLGLVSFAGYRLLSDDGGVIGVLALFSKQAISPEEDALLENLAATTTHIIQKAKTEEALRISHERFITVLDGIDATVYVADMQTYEILFMNKFMKDTFGKDLAGKICWNVFRGESGPCKHCKNSSLVDKNGMPTGVKVWQDENPITGKYYVNHDRAIQWTDGRLVKLQIATDITDLKTMEEELRQARKMESIGTLAGGIAHDFNNILFPIMGHTEMLLEDIPEDSPSRNSLKEIHTATLRAKNLVKQILTFSRQERSELNLMKIQPIIKETLKLIRATIPTTIEIKQDIQTDCGAVKADPTQIHQIVMNLATNAYHAVEETGGELNIRLKEVEFGDLDLFNPDINPPKYARLSISDTGKGMDKDIIKKIFDPFFTTKETGKGTGMGLSVVHGIVKNMNGTIKVDSRPDKGTEFHIYLPLAEAVIEQQQATNEASYIQNGTEHILLVDDENIVATVVKQMLERLGYQVTARTSSIEALEAFRASSDKFDIIITDMQMPNMSGDKLAFELTKIRPDIPILLCTGFSETMSEEKAFSMGIKGFLIKPIVLKDLSQKIREVLDGNKA